MSLNWMEVKAPTIWMREISLHTKLSTFQLSCIKDILKQASEAREATNPCCYRCYRKMLHCKMSQTPVEQYFSG